MSGRGWRKGCRLPETQRAIELAREMSAGGQRVNAAEVARRCGTSYEHTRLVLAQAGITRLTHGGARRVRTEPDALMLRILDALPGRCCDLAQALDAPEVNVRSRLRWMEGRGMVERERAGHLVTWRRVEVVSDERRAG